MTNIYFMQLIGTLNFLIASQYRDCKWSFIIWTLIGIMYYLSSLILSIFS